MGEKKAPVGILPVAPNFYINIIYKIYNIIYKIYKIIYKYINLYNI